MDRREFLGAGLAGVAAAIGGGMGLKQYDGASGQFVPAPALEYDAEKIMPYWKGAMCYEYDSTARNGNGGWVDTYLNDGLVGYWDFQPSSIVGDTVLDRSGNENDGRIHGSPRTSDGIIGQELVFDRDSTPYASITVPYDSSLNIQSGDFAISAWVRLEEIAGRRFGSTFPRHGIIERKDASGVPDAQSGYMLQVVGEGTYGASFENVVAPVYGNGFGPSTLKDGGRLTAGPYMHLLETFDSSTNTATIYVDGYERASSSFRTAPVVGQNDLQIGTHRTADGTIDGPLGGALSEIRLYNRALNRSEIDALVALGAGGGPSFSAEQQRVPSIFHTQNGTKYGYNDAVAVYDDSKANPYRLVVYGNDNVTNYNGHGNDFYESADLQNWSLVAENISPSATFADVVTVNGTHHVYAGGVELWTGSSLDSLTKQGYVGDFPDLGVFHENGTWYLFPEEDPAVDAPSGNKIGVWTSDRPDGGFTRQGTAIDVNDRPHYTGDPDIIKHDGQYWLFADAEKYHPFYGTLLARSDNLIDWEFVTDDIKSHVGGDLQMLKTPNGLVGFTEFAYNQFGGIGIQNITYLPE